MNSLLNLRRPLASAAILVAIASLPACGLLHRHASKPPPTGKPQASEAELRVEAGKLYSLARKQLDNQAYPEAIKLYDQLVARYPFTDYGTQAELERTFAQYKNSQYDDAGSNADRFLRDHPRHPHADYAQYLKGLVDMNRDWSFADMLNMNGNQADVSNPRLAYNDFALLVQKYPRSEYVGDARLRMIDLRDRLANHEIAIVRFYMKRGAWVAAMRRAEGLIADYPGAPPTAEALELLEQAQRAAGLQAQADESAKLLAANPGLQAPYSGDTPPPPGTVHPHRTPWWMKALRWL